MMLFLTQNKLNAGTEHEAHPIVMKGVHGSLLLLMKCTKLIYQQHA